MDVVTLVSELSDVLDLLEEGEDDDCDQLCKDTREHLKSILTKLGKLYFSKISLRVFKYISSETSNTALLQKTLSDKRPKFCN